MLDEEKDETHWARDNLRWAIIGFGDIDCHPNSSASRCSPNRARNCESSPCPSCTTSTAVDTVLAFHAALANGDADAALALMAENALIFESGGVERSRGEYAGRSKPCF
jgi:hypothetical protein